MENVSLELGYRRSGAAGQIQLSAYYMSKRNFIFRDADGFNVSDGSTRHRGLEMEYRRGWDRWSVDVSASYSRQHYAFSRAAAGRETIEAGNEVDTAPNWLGRVALERELGQGAARLEWVHQGGYFLDAANEHDVAH